MSSYIFDGQDSQYRVTLHDTYKRDRDGKSLIRYSLRRLSDNIIVFSGKDLYAPQCEKPTGKNAAISLLAFLTCKLGDTDAEYFDTYTPAQLDWCQSADCEALSLVVYDYENERTQ